MGAQYALWCISVVAVATRCVGVDSEPHHAEPWAIFEVLDINRDRFLSRDEISSSLQSDTDMSASTIIQEADDNGDGVIGLREFQTQFRSSTSAIASLWVPSTTVPPQGQDNVSRSVLEDLTKIAVATQNMLSAVPGIPRQGGRPKLATLHHFACSGGTLIARNLQAMRSVFLLSEVDPLSDMNVPPHARRFAPTDMLRHMREVHKTPAEQFFNDSDVAIVFLESMDALRRRAALKVPSKSLVLRDHAHSHFCRQSHVLARPTVRAILETRFDVHSAITVRHPMSSYLSLIANGWDDIGSLDE